MTIQEFLTVLAENKDKSLRFEYMNNAYVGANYHITEVKHLQVDSVDCGGQTDQWNETIVQLWESPIEKGKKEFMSSLKALGILNKVGKLKPYDLDSEVKFEYSNNNFHTAQLFVNDISFNNENITVHLGVAKTDCKAKELCGVPIPEKVAALVTDSCCDPQSGCC